MHVWRVFTINYIADNLFPFFFNALLMQEEEGKEGKSEFCNNFKIFGT